MRPGSTGWSCTGSRMDWEFRNPRTTGRRLSKKGLRWRTGAMNPGGGAGGAGKKGWSAGTPPADAPMTAMSRRCRVAFTIGLSLAPWHVGVPVEPRRLVLLDEGADGVGVAKRARGAGFEVLGRPDRPPHR